MSYSHADKDGARVVEGGAVRVHVAPASAPRR